MTVSGVIIHKIDSVTEEGIYGVKFLVYDQNKNPIGEYTTDDQGYIFVKGLSTELVISRGGDLHDLIAAQGKGFGGGHAPGVGGDVVHHAGSRPNAPPDISWIVRPITSP